MSGLHIANGLTLPIDFATEASAILARRGRGKTYTAMVLAEELHAADQPFVVLDPVGVCWGLRSSADGTKPGLEVKILGGEHSDVPLEATAGKLIATFVVDHPAAYVIDLSGFEHKADHDRFVADFAERIYRYKAAQERRTPLTMIIDEADQFAPQKPRERGGVGPRMLGALESIVRQGRARGLGCVLITQRPAVLNKDVLTQAGALILLGITGPQDRKAINEWIVGHADEAERREVIGSLAGLGVGEAWVWWPTEELLRRVHIRARRTFDSSSTPRSGEAQAAVRFADVDLDALKDAIADSVERAKAEDPKLLQARIRDLEAELRRRPTEVETKVETVVERVEIPVLDAAVAAKVEEAVQSLTFGADHLGEALGEILTKLATFDAPPTRPALAEARGPIRTAPALAARREQPAPAPRDIVDGDLPEGQRRVLTAVAQYDAGVDRTQLSILTGYKRSTRDRYLQYLNADGLVNVNGPVITVTDAGLAALGDFEPLPTGAALLKYWLDKLPDGERRVLAVLADHYPDQVHRDAISEATGYKRSTRDRYLQYLQARKIVTTTPGHARAADVLFEEQ